jgi:predicted nucleic acid-binding protein
VIVDTSALLAFLDRLEQAHHSVCAAVDASAGPFLVSEMVLAELDYLVLSRYGVEAEFKMLEALADGSWTIESLTADELPTAKTVVTRHRDLEIGLTDATNVVLAHRFRTPTIFTLDHRHFDVLRQMNGRPFEVLPR